MSGFSLDSFGKKFGTVPNFTQEKGTGPVQDCPSEKSGLVPTYLYFQGEEKRLARERFDV
jgi:hypothetical protein